MRLALLLQLVPLALGVALPAAENHDSIKAPEHPDEKALLNFFAGENYQGNSTFSGCKDHIDACVKVDHPVIDSIAFQGSSDEHPYECAFYNDNACGTYRGWKEIRFSESVPTLETYKWSSNIKSYTCKWLEFPPEDPKDPEDPQEPAVPPHLLRLFQDYNYTGVSEDVGTPDTVEVCFRTNITGTSSFQFFPSGEDRKLGCTFHDTPNCTMTDNAMFATKNVSSLEGLPIDNKLKSLWCNWLTRGPPPPAKRAKEQSLAAVRQDLEGGKYLLRLYREVNYGGEPLYSGNSDKIDDCTPTVSGISSLRLILQKGGRRFSCTFYDNTECKLATRGRLQLGQDTPDLGRWEWNDQIRAHKCYYLPEPCEDCLTRE